MSISYLRKSIIALFSRLSRCYNTLTSQEERTAPRKFINRKTINGANHAPHILWRYLTMKTIKNYFRSIICQYGEIVEMNGRVWHI